MNLGDRGARCEPVPLGRSLHLEFMCRFRVLRGLSMIVPRLRAPIVLVHGLFGFTQVRLGGWVLAQYFRDVPQALRAAGNRVLLASLSPTGGIADRAAQLKR